MSVTARIAIIPKPAILDPQGKAVHASLSSLGYEEVRDVRIGKLVVLELDETNPDRARQRVEEMCRRLLANEVIEDYSFEIVTEEPKNSR